MSTRIPTPVLSPEQSGAGFPWRGPEQSVPALPDNAALLLIDFQEAIDDPVWGRRNNPRAEAVAARLLAQWRTARRPVIHVQHLSTEPASPYRPGQPGVEFKAALSPLAGELVVQKATTSAFVDTGLEALLRQQGIATLVVAGVITNNSVEATVRTAGNLGYRAFVVSDATATVERHDLDGRLWSAEEVHALSLANMHGEYATVVDSRAVLAAYGEAPEPEHPCTPGVDGAWGAAPDAVLDFVI